jgi:simple sugar transport system ATP-binding protein
VLIAAQPTWGVDAGAAAAIHQALLDLAAHGVAVLVVSQDLDELLALTDRLAVINVGRLSRPLVTAEASVEEIGLLMGGLHDLPDETPTIDQHGEAVTAHG